MATAAVRDLTELKKLQVKKTPGRVYDARKHN